MRLALTDGGQAINHLFFATELMLRELQEAAGIEVSDDRRLTLGWHHDSLCPGRSITGVQRQDLSFIVQTRNLWAHRPLPATSMELLESVGPLQFKLVTIFTWYLAESEHGPQLDKTRLLTSSVMLRTR